MARRPPISLTQPSQELEPEKVPEAQLRMGWRKAATREGKRAVAFWADKADYLELQVATARMETTIQAAGLEMLSDWFAKHGIRQPSKENQR
jgi:hypothetical protein